MILMFFVLIFLCWFSVEQIGRITIILSTFFHMFNNFILLDSISSFTLHSTLLPTLRGPYWVLSFLISFILFSFPVALASFFIRFNSLPFILLYFGHSLGIEVIDLVVWIAPLKYDDFDFDFYLNWDHDLRLTSKSCNMKKS